MATRKVGDQGEKLVIQDETRRLREAGRGDLAEQIDHPAERREYPGYDIESFNSDGSRRLIEVKASLGEQTAFFLSENEWRAAKGFGASYWIYLVAGAFKRHVKIERIQDPAGLVDTGQLDLSVERYVMRT